MINDFLKNFCLISFALFGPITLPAGGIQRFLNEYELLNNSKEIILTSNCSLYTYPKLTAKKLNLLNSGYSVLVLQKWKANESDTWLRVELATNYFIDNPNNIRRGWIRI